MKRTGKNIDRLTDLILKRFFGLLSEKEAKESEEILSDKSTINNAAQLTEERFITENINRESTFDYKSAFEQFYKTTRKNRRIKVMRRLRIASVVALPILLVGVGYWVTSDKMKFSDDMAVADSIVPGISRAYIILDDGKKLNLDTLKKELKEKGGTVLSPSMGKISYKHIDSVASPSKLVYNTLNVPRGGEYNVQLADGTYMWVNSESSVRFPVHFTGKKREIFVSGEVFLNVAKDKEKPFIVHTSKGNVRVLGTKFNVRDYKDEDQHITTLVSGSVEYSSSTGKVILKPGEQVRDEEKSDKLTVKEVNVREFISWKDGMYVFNHTRLEDMMKTVERWYDVDVFFLNEDAKSLRFSGELERYENIDKLLDFIKIGGDVRFKIKGKTITVIKK